MHAICSIQMSGIDADTSQQAPQTLKQRFNIVRRLSHAMEPLFEQRADRMWV